MDELVAKPYNACAWSRSVAAYDASERDGGPEIPSDRFAYNAEQAANAAAAFAATSVPGLNAVVKRDYKAS